MTAFLPIVVFQNRSGRTGAAAMPGVVDVITVLFHDSNRSLAVK
jgi:hypothetical protein